MPDQIPFASACLDRSNSLGFQFLFLCWRCGTGYASSFMAAASLSADAGGYALGKAAGYIPVIGNFLGDKAADVVKDQAKEEAQRRAIAEVFPTFRQCPRCGRWRCLPHCWHAAANVCLDCAPLGVPASPPVGTIFPVSPPPFPGGGYPPPAGYFPSANTMPPVVSPYPPPMPPSYAPPFVSPPPRPVPARGRGAVWAASLWSTLGFGLVMVLLCLVIDAQPDPTAYLRAQTNGLGAVFFLAWLMAVGGASFFAGSRAGRLGSGVVAGVLTGGLSGMSYILLLSLLTPYWYHSGVGGFGPWFVGAIALITGILATGCGALVGLIGGAIGAATHTPSQER